MTRQTADRPGDGEQLSEVLAEQGSAELVLCGPGRGDRRLRRGVTVDVGVRQRRHDEDPAQEPHQGQDDGGGSEVGSRPEQGIVASPEHRRQEQDRNDQDRVGPRGREPDPHQARAALDELREHHVGRLAEDVGPVERRRQHGRRRPERECPHHEEQSGGPAKPPPVDRVSRHRLDTGTLGHVVSPLVGARTREVDGLLLSNLRARRAPGKASTDASSDTRVVPIGRTVRYLRRGRQ